MRVKKSFILLLLLSVGVMIPFIAPYWSLEPARSRIPITSAAVQFPLLIAHIGSACVALLTGFVQIAEPIRLRKPRVHRFAGRLYVGSVLLSGVLAFGVMGFEPDYTRAASFLVLDALWLYTCWKGYRTAVRRNFREHRAWMIRSFGITLVAVGARICVPFLILAYLLLHGLTLPDGRSAMVQEVLSVNTWAGLVLELVLVEWIVLRSGSAGNGA